jgi:hypothetical protein
MVKDTNPCLSGLRYYGTQYSGNLALHRGL